MPTHLCRSSFPQPQWLWLLFVLTLLVPTARPDDPQPSAPGQTQPSPLKSLSSRTAFSKSRSPRRRRNRRRHFSSPVAIYVITGEDIRRSGVTTIPDALRLAPGVEVARIDGSKWSVGIRGFGTRLSRDVLVLIDGRTVYTPLFAGTYWEVQDTLLEDIDRIEVIRGPGGTIWGPNAVDGVINIITKSTKDTQGAFASGEAETRSRASSISAMAATMATDSPIASMRKGFTRGPEDHPDHDNFDDWRGVQGGFRMDWSRRRPRCSSPFRATPISRKTASAFQLTTYTPPFTGNVDGNAELSGGNVLFRWKRTLSERQRLPASGLLRPHQSL